MSPTRVPASTDLVLMSLHDRMQRAAAGDLDAAAEAAQLLAVLDHALTHGAALPQAWQDAVPAGAASEVTIDIEADSFVVTAPGRAGGAVEAVTFEQDDQFGFDFTAPLPLAPAPAVTRFPQPVKARPGTPRHGSVGERALPVDMPSTLAHGTFTAGFNNPTQSLQVQQKMALRAGRFNHQVFWLIYDTPGGLADHEMEKILGRSHQSLSATRNTLMNKGYIKASGETRKTPFGNDAAVWVPTEEAIERVRRGAEQRAA